MRHFRVCVQWPEDRDDQYEAIDWPEEAPLPRWGERFIDVRKNTPEGNAVYLVNDSTWLFKKGPLGVDVDYLIVLEEDYDYEDDDDDDDE